MQRCLDYTTEMSQPIALYWETVVTFRRLFDLFNVERYPITLSDGFGRLEHRYVAKTWEPTGTGITRGVTNETYR
jgi:hypothetical protein